ncbi:hypothetical protein RIF29_09611 [Crotalaria pallida]|uniref:Uncharacterized protein n=1 Tax=Crotalaria pallida TaxID=3830 RepID=A0AAN9ILN3_CROPI
MKGPCVICYGLIQMTDVAGVFLLVVLDTLLARNKRWLPFLAHLTIVTDVGTWLPYWRLTIARATHLSSLNLLQGEENPMSHVERLITSCNVPAECSGYHCCLYFCANFKVREHAASVLAGLMKGGDENLAKYFCDRAY